MRRVMVVATTVVLVMSGCSSEPAPDEVATSKGAPTPGQELFPVVASSEVVVGENRLQIGLIDEQDAPVRSSKTKLTVHLVAPGEGMPSSSTVMSFVWTIKPVQGLWVGEATFDRPGEWRALIDVEGGGFDTQARTVIKVTKEGTTPAIGEKPPASDTPTSADVDSLDEISTDTDPDPSFYELSISDALAARKPAVVVFATPKFCSSQVCGPTLSLVKEVATRFPRVNFVHVEPYDLDKVPEKLEPVPAVIEWGLPSEPWIFVTDASGLLAAKYEGSVAPRELTSLLSSLARGS